MKYSEIQNKEPPDDLDFMQSSWSDIARAVVEVSTPLFRSRIEVSRRHFFLEVNE